MNAKPSKDYNDSKDESVCMPKYCLQSCSRNSRCFRNQLRRCSPRFSRICGDVGIPGIPSTPERQRMVARNIVCLHLMDILNLREILVKAVLVAADTTFDSYHVSTTSPGTGRLSALQHSRRDREAFLLHLDQRQLHLCIPGLFEAACHPTCRNVAKLHDHNKYQCFFLHRTAQML